MRWPTVGYSKVFHASRARASPGHSPILTRKTRCNTGQSSSPRQRPARRTGLNYGRPLCSAQRLFCSAKSTVIGRHIHSGLSIKNHSDIGYIVSFSYRFVAAWVQIMGYSLRSIVKKMVQTPCLHERNSCHPPFFFCSVIPSR